MGWKSGFLSTCIFSLSDLAAFFAWLDWSDRSGTLLEVLRREVLDELVELSHLGGLLGLADALEVEH